MNNILDEVIKEFEKLKIKQYFKDKQQGKKEFVTLSKQELYEKEIIMLNFIKKYLQTDHNSL